MAVRVWPCVLHRWAGPDLQTERVNQAAETLQRQEAAQLLQSCPVGPAGWLIISSDRRASHAVPFAEGLVVGSLIVLAKALCSRTDTFVFM